MQRKSLFSTYVKNIISVSERSQSVCIIVHTSHKQGKSHRIALHDNNQYMGQVVLANNLQYTNKAYAGAPGAVDLLQPLHILWGA